MENDQAFETDAVLDAQVRVRTSRTKSGGSLGVASVVTANGGLGKRTASAHSEETPLLGGSNEQNGRRESTWPGELDFEGHTWWNKPSVCLAFIELHDNLTDPTRCTGYWGPSSSMPLHLVVL